ncbi:MAG: cysteine desulfurase family protein [Bacilli bacterium]|nr:cysteine desulfurase family protein [Bacilli bacterium]
MIYFDSAATSKVDEEILDSYYKFLKMYYANSSSTHKMGEEVSIIFDKARKQIADILKINSDELIFTSGASEANNMALKGILLKNIKTKKHVITSKVEHPSILNCLKELEEMIDLEVTYLDVNNEGVISLDDLKNSIKENTVLVSIMFVNNETGAINDIEGIKDVLKGKNILFHCDATQGFMKLPLDLKGIDLLSMSGHKLYGLKGAGLLVKKRHVNLLPLINGGSQEFNLRAGTSNYPLMISLSKTIRLAYENQAKYYKHVSTLRSYLYNELIKMDEVLINSPQNGSPYVLNFSLKGVNAKVIHNYLQTKGIMVSTVSACSSSKITTSYVILNMFNDVSRASSSLRVSFSKYNTLEEVKELIKALKEAIINIKR